MRDKCSVCYLSTWDDDNLLVFCDGVRCGILIHQKCYGIKVIPPDDIPWYCNVCVQKQKGIATCVVCGGRDGALKETVEGNWAHIVCALAMPELFFYEKATLERICGLSNPSLRTRDSGRLEVCSRTIDSADLTPPPFSSLTLDLYSLQHSKCWLYAAVCSIQLSEIVPSNVSTRKPFTDATFAIRQASQIVLCPTSTQGGM